MGLALLAQLVWICDPAGRVRSVFLSSTRCVFWEAASFPLSLWLVGKLNFGVTYKEVNFGHRYKPCLANSAFFNNKANILTSIFLTPVSPPTLVEVG